jgi:SAM-dependent methyltransferase
MRFPARQKNTSTLKNVTLIEGDIAKVDLGKQFDIVYCIGVLHHTDNPNASFANIARHCKPGGKVIHGPTRESKASRHHSNSKAPVLTDAPDEHEDISFGAFDGQMLDLSPIIREQLILQIPMRSLCAESCKGLCLECGENINENKCRCKNGPTLVSPEDEGGEKKSLSPLAQALQKKILTR